MEYYYAPPEKRHGDTLLIDGQEFLHLSQVMRRVPGDRLTAVDGCGTAYAVAIREIAHRTAYCDILETMPRLHEPGTEVTLGVALLKHGASFDYIVEKVTELGVSRIVPLLTQRTVRRHGREARWEHLALAAMKQCGRCLLPAILPVTTFAEFLQGFPPESVKCIPHEKILEPLIGTALKELGTGRVALAIGPEGGFTEEEVDAAVLAGFRVVSLGPRRLRTETAAAVAVWAAVCAAQT
jgi:16S rRNA (uracil1498-N3)-methyltransferase